MKNFSKYAVLAVFATFTVFLVGVFVGRIYNPAVTLVSNITQSTKDDQYTYDITDTRPYIDNKLNINAATADDLMMLPGIGETLAKRIIDYRTENGPFKSIDELENVKGIGNSLITNIREYLTIGG